jgi:hypothetical protein
MIVVDESILDADIVRAIAVWYPVRVLTVLRLRPGMIIKDEAIPALLGQSSQPTFVTINVSDFWRRIRADHRYCVITLELAQEQALGLPDLLRRLLRVPEFHTKAARMGKVIRVRPTHVEYYGADRHIYTLAWPDD